MTNKRLKHTAIGIGAALFLLPALTLAEVAGLDPFTAAKAPEDAGVTLTFGIKSTFRAGDHLGFATNAPGTYMTLDNALSFGLQSKTQLSTLALTVSGVARATNIPGAAQSAFDDRKVELSYAREVANSRIAVSGNYNRASMQFLDPLGLTSVSTSDLIPSTGTRLGYGGALTWETGLNGPLGLQIDARRQATQYKDVSDPSVYDSSHTHLGATVKMRFSEATRGTLTATHDYFTATDPLMTDRRIDTLSFGISHDIDAATTVTASLGAGRETTRTTSFGTRNTVAATDAIASLGVIRTLTNGTAGLAFDRTIEINGPRNAIRASRAFDLSETGKVDFTLGASKSNGARNAQVIGALNITEETASGKFRFGLTRDLAADAPLDEQLITRLSLYYERPINHVSSMTFATEFARAEDAGYGTIKAHSWARAAVSYNRAITPDWAVQAGVQHVQSAGTSSVAGSSNSVFVALGRSFTFRP